MRISDWSSDVCSSDLIQESDAARSSNLFLASGGGSASASTAEQPAPPAVQAIIPPGAEAPARPFLRADGPRRTDSRSEERRVGKEGVRTCRSRWSPDH